MMSRLVTIVFLGLVPVLALAEGVSETTCEVTIELSSGVELETIHNNVLCLHQRLDEIRGKVMGESAEEYEGGQGKYVVLKPGDEEGTDVDPCDRSDSFNAKLCQKRVLKTFWNFCATGDCAEGFETWHRFMPENWKNYLNTEEDQAYSFSPGTWLSGVLNEPNLFTLDRNRRMLNMQQFFKTVPPNSVLSPIVVPTR